MKSLLISLIVMTIAPSILFAQSSARLPNFDQYCDRVQSAFNITAQGRSVPFKFTNYRGHEQTSEATFIVTGVDYCVPGTAKTFMSLNRTNGGNINIGVFFSKLGNNEFDVKVSLSDCADKFYNYAKPLLERSGVVFTSQFENEFQTNNRTQYCPNMEKAVAAELIRVIQQM